MIFSGIQKTTLIDYPGKVAATLFTYGCDFRCPFCHNPELVIETSRGEIKEGEVLKFLESRIGKLDGVVITGGEPLMNKDLPRFIKRVKSFGFSVKVDTNGSFPDRIKELLGLVDCWAMDIKNSPEKYSATAMIDVNIEDIKKSVNLIMRSGVDYEFRTTVVPGLHDDSDIKKIGELINGAKFFSIQNFRCGKTIDPKYSDTESFKSSDLKRMKKIIEPFVEKVRVVEN